MSQQRIGYIRVSSILQNTDRQLDGIELDRTFTDKVSGKDVNRPELTAMLSHVRSGDTVFVHSIDRLARNLTDLRTVITDLNSKGVTVTFTKNNLTFSGNDSATSTLLLNMLGAVAEFERSMILDRQREGIQIAKEKGKYKGRKQEMTPDIIADITQRVEHGQSKSQIAKELGISRDTLYRYLTL